MDLEERKPLVPLAPLGVEQSRLRVGEVVPRVEEGHPEIVRAPILA